jgi:hypothetical protein
VTFRGTLGFWGTPVVNVWSMVTLCVNTTLNSVLPVDGSICRQLSTCSWNMLMYETLKLSIFCRFMLWLIVNIWRVAPSVCIEYMLMYVFVYIYIYTHLCWAMHFLFISLRVFFYLLSLGRTKFCFQCAESNFYRRSIFEAVESSRVKCILLDSMT